MCSEFQGPCPPPSASGSSQPCVVSCGASRVIIFPPPVLVTFPGPIISTCPQETVVGSSGMVLGSSGMPEEGAGSSLRSHGVEIPRRGEFIPKFTSGPVLGVDPRETLVGSLGMLEGGAGTSRTSLRSHGAQIPRSRGFIPKFGPRRASRCSYIFNSRWIHPCRRSSCGSQQLAGNGREEKIPDPEKPGTENTDAEKEENEVLEV
ncbi:uncharacterized protein LOC111939592 [Cyanistes caeruleus]|uniref:uncharacterized protein LOC111939592 n=1 Tax=Cyanistes caeruleus TaxID=156563 RepID=UPI000CDA98EA|nr:uncharacterized protein LOC111939592 [Cyanistes caeruleus]